MTVVWAAWIFAFYVAATQVSVLRDRQWRGTSLTPDFGDMADIVNREYHPILGALSVRVYIAGQLSCIDYDRG
jgi:hypothetical protein